MPAQFHKSHTMIYQTPHCLSTQSLKNALQIAFTITKFVLKFHSFSPVHAWFSQLWRLSMLEGSTLLCLCVKSVRCVRFFFPPTLIGLLVYFQEVWSDRSVCVCVCVRLWTYIPAKECSRDGSVYASGWPPQKQQASLCETGYTAHVCKIAGREWFIGGLLSW